MSTDDFPMPYSVRWFLATRYWYYVGVGQRQTGEASNFHRHYLPEGIYQITGTTIAGRGSRLTVFGNDTDISFRHEFIPPGDEGTSRSGTVNIHIPAGGGYVECTPRDQTGGAKPTDDLNTPLMMQVFPLVPYKP